MSWSRPALALVALLALCGCGWQPLYGRVGEGTEASGGNAGPALATVHITTIANRTGMILYNELRDRMNPAGTPADPNYDLVVSVSESTDQMLILEDQSASRIDLTLSANFALYQRGNKTPVLKGVSKSATSYDILGDTSEFATIQSANDAHKRGAQSIADDITDRVAVFLAQPTGG